MASYEKPIEDCHENATFRDGEKAVKLAESVCEISGRSDPSLLDTLAAAYAETGRFEEARQTAQEAIDLAQSTGYDSLEKDIKSRIRLYESNRPFREKRSLPGP